MNTPTLSKASQKMSQYMTDLGLTENKDFKVSDGPGNRVCVHLNTGHNIGSYRKGLEQRLVDTGHTLELTNVTLFTREKKKSA